MKFLLTLFVLFFSSFVNAEDISDFQIEGISIGDSLLDHLSEDEIKKNMTDIYNYIEEKKFIVTGFFPNDSKSEYNIIQLTLKLNDSKYTIYGVGGNITDISESKCLSKQQEVDKYISNIFKDYDRSDLIIAPHPADTSNKSTVTQIAYRLINGGVELIECDNFSNAVSYPDSFVLSLYSKELNQWLQKFQ